MWLYDREIIGHILLVRESREAGVRARHVGDLDVSYIVKSQVAMERQREKSGVLEHSSFVTRHVTIHGSFDGIGKPLLEDISLMDGQRRNHGPAAGLCFAISYESKVLKNYVDG